MRLTIIFNFVRIIIDFLRVRLFVISTNANQHCFPDRSRRQIDWTCYRNCCCRNCVCQCADGDEVCNNFLMSLVERRSCHNSISAMGFINKDTACMILDNTRTNNFRRKESLCRKDTPLVVRSCLSRHRFFSSATKHDNCIVSIIWSIAIQIKC